MEDEENQFYKANEEITLRFYQMPKVLFENKYYQGMSIGAKAIYSILRDRMELSIKNNWYDEERNIYLVFGNEQLAELLNLNKKTVIKYKKELARYRLIIDRRLGQGKPNRIYILKPRLITPGPEPEKSPHPNLGKDCNIQKCKVYTSRYVNDSLLEVESLHPNDTEYSDTEINETINPTAPYLIQETPALYEADTHDRLNDKKHLPLQEKTPSPKNTAAALLQTLQKQYGTQIAGQTIRTINQQLQRKNNIVNISAYAFKIAESKQQQLKLLTQYSQDQIQQQQTAKKEYLLNSQNQKQDKFQRFYQSRGIDGSNPSAILAALFGSHSGCPTPIHKT